MPYTRKHALVAGAGILLASVVVSITGVVAHAEARPATAAETATATASPTSCAEVVLDMDAPDAATRETGPQIPECQVLGLTPEDGETAPTRARLMTLGEADALLSTGVLGLVPSDIPVWVITVHKPMMTKGSPLTLPQTFPVYSSVINAQSGWTYTFGIGSNALG